MALPLLKFTKTLTSAPIFFSSDGIAIRTFESRDIPGWLALRETAFHGLVAAGRAWTMVDFEREFVAKPWWSPQRMWLASDEAGKVIAAVTLGRSGRPPHDEPCAMWLMVDPKHRRRGLGRALLTTLERAVWEAGERSVTLETHAAWTDAVRLYEQSGYQRS